MEHTTNIKRTVMRRVYTLFVLRHLTSEKVLGAFLVAVSLFMLSRFVFVAEVVKNILALNGVESFFVYVVDAVVSTDVAVQVTLLLITFGSVLMVRDSLRILKSRPQFAS
jgi:hypothetical protein